MERDGFDVVRLAVSWGRLEPQRGRWDTGVPRGYRECGAPAQQPSHLRRARHHCLAWSAAFGGSGCIGAGPPSPGFPDLPISALGDSATPPLSPAVKPPQHLFLAVTGLAGGPPCNRGGCWGGTSAATAGLLCFLTSTTSRISSRCHRFASSVISSGRCAHTIDVPSARWTPTISSSSRVSCFRRLRHHDRPTPGAGPRVLARHEYTGSLVGPIFEATRSRWTAT